MSAQVAQVLRDALGLLESDGWGQGHFRNNATGARCASNGISTAAEGLSNELWSKSFQAFIRVTGDPVTHRWNDTPGRTVDEVFEAFKAAIVAEEAAGS